MSPLLSVTLLIALTAPAQADPRAEAIAPFVGDEVAAVLHLDLTDLDINALARRALAGVMDEREIDDVLQDMSGWLEELRKAGVQDFYVLVDPMDLPGPPVAVVPLTEGADAEAIGRVLCGDGDQPAPFTWPTCATVQGAVFAGTDTALERVRRPAPAPRPEVAAAFAASGEAPARILIVPSANQRRVFEEMVPALPQELGSAPITTLTRGVQWAAIALEAEPTTTLRVVVQSQDPAAAQALNRLAQDALNLVKQALQGEEPMRELVEALDQVEPEVADDRLMLAVDLEQASALVGVPLRQAREAARRAQCTNNLKHIGLALHNYHARHQAFPPAYSTAEDGTPLLSWRVHILPYLEQQSLYDEFHLDEPWDSPHNQALIERMPEVYLCPSAGLREGGRTTCLVPRGEGTIFPGAEGVTIREITDGTSNTLFVVDANADHAVVWTKPDDWDVGDEPDTEALFGNHPEGTNALFADGSVRFLRETIAPTVLRALTTRSGREVIGPRDL